MKRFFLTVLFLCAVLSFAACGTATEDAAAAEAHGTGLDGSSAYDGNGSSPYVDGSSAHGGSGGGDNESEALLFVTVTRVVDGDTLEVSIDGTTEKVRLIGVDTPESVHPDAEKNVPYGEIASEFTKNALLDAEVGLEFDAEERDRYGRLLAYVYIDGEMFNKRLIDEGHAILATYPPNVKYVELFTEAQTVARQAGKGVWADEPVTPATQDDSGLSPQASSGQSSESAEASYIGTVNSYKFHTRACAWGQKILEQNAVYFNTRDEAVAAGFVPCLVCNP